MSIEQQISRILAAKIKIRDRMIDFGVATEADNLTTLATKIEGMPDNGAVSVDIVEGKSYTIPRGWHNGAGVVKAMTDTEGEAELYKTQSKTVTPTKSQQTVASDEGYYALESVTVNPIPDAYQDVTAVTATKDQVLTGATYVTKDGTVTAGTMPNNGAVKDTLTPTKTTYGVPKGFHSGGGSIGVAVEDKTFTPTKDTQTHNASTKFVGKVVVNPIPANFKDVTNVTAEAAHVLIGKKFLTSDTAEQSVAEGTMPNLGGVNFSIVGTTDLNNFYTIPAGYHDGTGVVSLSDVIENQLAEI